MAPRAYWKGYLKLSLVSCPIALFPAKVDAESGDEVDSADIIKGYEVGKGDYIELDPEERDN